MGSAVHKPQAFDYFLVLDFEATCEKNTKPTPQVSLRIVIAL